MARENDDEVVCPRTRQIFNIDEAVKVFVMWLICVVNHIAGPSWSMILQYIYMQELICFSIDIIFSLYMYEIYNKII